MNRPLISICVPVYNVAPYIERCARSLMEQSYPELEFIFVDDASTDDSLVQLQQVLNAYPERKNQVVLLHNDHNHGLAYTRRRTIEEAHGKYVLCVDSDDYIEADTAQRMVDEAQATGADIVAAGFVHEYAHRQEIAMPTSGEVDTDYVYLALTDQLPHLCNKLILRSLFTEGRSCYAPEGMDYLEDRLTVFFLLTKAKHIASLQSATYHYVHREDSVSQDKNEKHFLCLLRYWKEVDLVLSELGLSESYKAVVGKQKIEDKAFLLHFCDNRTRKQFADIFAEEEKEYSPELSRGVALMYRLSKHHLWVLTYLYERYIHCYAKLKKRSRTV